MSRALGGHAYLLLCENLLSFAPAASSFCQPSTSCLIANTAEECAASDCLRLSPSISVELLFYLAFVRRC